MGTLVGQWYNLGSNCTGSLGDLNNCGYSSNTSEEFIQQNWDTESNNISFPSWMSKSNHQTMDLDERSLKTSFMNSLILDMQDFSKTDIFTETSNSHNSANLLSLTQLLGLSRLMNFIMYKSRQTNTDAELVGNVHQRSFTDYIFAQSQLERKARRRSHYPILKTFSHSNSLNASLTSIVEADHFVHSKWDTIETYFSKRCRRRHCNSESGLFSLEDNLSSLFLHDIEYTKSKNDNEEDKQNLSTNITTSIHLEEAQNISSTSLDLKTNNFGEMETNNENACSHYQFEDDNCLSLINKQNELLLINTNENDNQFSLSAENLNLNCINELQNELSLINITNSIESNNEPVNNIVNKPITRSSTSKNNMKLNKSVSFADEVGKSLTEIFTLCDDDELYNGFSELDTLDNYNFGSIKDYKSYDNQNKRSKFQIFYGDEYFDTESPGKTQNTYENNNNNNQLMKFNTTDIESHYIWSLTFSQPASRYYEFRQKLEKFMISLESINIIQSNTTTTTTTTTTTNNNNNNNNSNNNNNNSKPLTSYIRLKGTIKIKNICYDKLVYIRLTKDNWKTFIDYPAVYSSQLSSSTWSNTKRYDTFIFNILIESDQQSFNPNDKIEFAICFIAFNNNHNNDKTEYWDNNNNENYIIEQRKLHPHLINIMNINNSQSSNQDDTQTNQLSIIDKSLNNNDNNNNTNCTIEYNIPSYTLDCRPNFDGFTSFTNYRAWNHFSGETSYY
ncbi:unnamed protein product [Schistosoma intercalatum]|nr:unnamed protein product [Schistosoma intercalatum]